jgi:hypothetical protein
VKLWPFHRWSFETSLSTEEALRLLHADIGSQGRMIVGPLPLNTTVSANSERRAFIGRRLPDGAEFTINLNTEPGELKQHNSFQPVIRAGIEPSARGARIFATARGSALVMLFLLAWTSVFVGLGALIASGMAQVEGPHGWAPLLLLPVMCSIPWLISGFTFSEDAETAERLLRVTLERD